MASGDRPEGPAEKRLRIAARVSAAFRVRGYRVIQYGGATVEQYTRGGYATGDVDLGFDGAAPDMGEKNEVMQALGSKPALRLFRVEDVVVDLGGSAELLSRNFVEVDTIEGPVVLEAPEEAIVQRVLVAVYPQPNAEQRQAAKLLLAQAEAGNLDVDWGEVRRIAGLPVYRVWEEIEALRSECRLELGISG